MAMKRNAKMENLGLVISFTTFVLGIIVAICSKQAIISVPASLFGIVMGIAFSIGFCMIIFYCLKIGPSGPTTALNNLGVLFPIILSMTIFSKTGHVKTFSIIGVILTIIALLSMAFVNSNGVVKVSNKWKILVFIGWLFSGLSLSMQFLATYFDANASFAFAISAYFTSFIILLCISVYRGNIKLSKTEIAAGTVNGIVSIISAPLLFYTIKFIAGYIVFPVILIIPIIAMMLFGNFIYKEKLNMVGWLATLFGVVGILLMYI